MSGLDQRPPTTIFSFQPIPQSFNKHQHPTNPPSPPTTKPLTTPRPVGNPSHSTSPPTLTSPPPPLSQTTTRRWGNTTRHGSKHRFPTRSSARRTRRPLEKKKISVYMWVSMHPRLERIERPAMGGYMPVESARRQDKLVKHWDARLGTWCVCRPGSGSGWVWFWSGVTRRVCVPWPGGLKEVNGETG